MTADVHGCIRSCTGLVLAGLVDFWTYRGMTSCLTDVEDSTFFEVLVLLCHNLELPYINEDILIKNIE